MQHQEPSQQQNKNTNTKITAATRLPSRRSPYASGRCPFRPSGDDQRTGPPADSRRRHRRRRRRRRTTAMMAASASAPDSDGLDSLDESLGRGGARKPSFPSPAAAVIAFERAVSQRLPR